MGTPLGLLPAVPYKEKIYLEQHPVLQGEVLVPPSKPGVCNHRSEY